MVDLAVVALAVLARAAAVLVLQSHELARSTYEHGEIAANLVNGRGFSMHFLGADGPTAQQAPLYPMLVAAAYAIGGLETPRALLMIELAQALLGGVLVMGVMRLAGSILPDRAWPRWAAGVIVAVHPTLVYAATHVQVALLGTTLLVWTLAWGYRTGQTGRIGDAAATGLLLALLALTDPILSLAVLGVAGAVWIGRAGTDRPVRQSIALVVTVLIVGGLGITPWVARNALVMGEFVAIKSTFGYAFWQGNCAFSQGTDKVVRSSVARVFEQTRMGAGLDRLNRTLWQARHEAGYLDDIALTKADYQLLGSVSEPERSRILFRRALADLWSEPGRYRDLCWRRLWYFLFFDETNPKSWLWIYRIPHLGLTILAVAGLLLASADARRRLWPTIATVVAITLFHTLTIVSARFHIPIEPLLAIWGAAGLTRWHHRGAETLVPSTAAGHHVERVRIKRRLAVAGDKR